MDCRLTDIFKFQRELQTKLGTFDKIQTPADRQEFVNQMLLAMFEETVEVMRETPYKNPAFVKFGWKKTQIGDINKLREELVDLLHFFVNICLVNNFTAEDIFQTYCKKNSINAERHSSGY